MRLTWAAALVFASAAFLAGSGAAFCADEPRWDEVRTKLSRLPVKEGVYLAPSQFEAGFMSAAHGDQEVTATIAAAERAFRRLG